MPDESQVEFINLQCGECQKPLRVGVGYDFINHFAASGISARATGPSSYCAQCGLAFCSSHAVWKGFQGQGLIYNPYCPNCGEMMRGYSEKKRPAVRQSSPKAIVLADVASLLFKNGPPAVLCGAGISAADPSELPVARTLIEMYDARLRHCLEKDNRFLSLFPPLDEWASKIRFEEMISYFRLLGYETEPIESLNCSNQTNLNHKFLAALHKFGCPLLTTNFDSLIEISILESGQEVRQLINSNEFSVDPPDYSAIAKLHGSFWRWDGQEWKDSRDSLCTSIEGVGAQFVQYSYNADQKIFLNKLISSHPLLVLGYSGSDDFDISPLVLRSNRQQLLVWVQHDSNLPNPILATCREELPENWRVQVPRGLFPEDSRASNVVYVRCDTSAVLSWLVNDYLKLPQQSIYTSDLAYPPISRSELPPAFLTKSWEALAVAGWIWERFPSLDHACKAFSLASEMAKACGDEKNTLWLAASVAEIKILQGKYEHAFRDASHYLASARRYGDKLSSSVFLRIMGSAISNKDIHAALEYYGEAAKLAQEAEHLYSYGVSLRKLGRCYWILGERDRSLETLDSSFHTLESIGCLEEMKNSLYELGVSEYEAGQFEASQSIFTESLRLARLLGDADHASLIQHELGLVAARTGDRKLAKILLESALDYASSAGEYSRIATAKKELAVLALKSGEIEHAKILEEESSAIFESIGHLYFLGHNRQVRAMILLTLGQINAGCNCLEEAILISTKVGDSVNVRNCSKMIAQIRSAKFPEGTPIKFQ